MGVLARAPFLAVLAGLAAMLAWSDRVVWWALPLAALLVTCGVAASSFRSELKGQWRIAAFVAVCVLLCSSWMVFSLVPPPVPSSLVDTEGIVVESRPWGRMYAVAVKTPEGGFVVRLPFATLPEGSRVRLRGMPRPFRGAAAGSDFREDRFWYARGMTAQLGSVKTELLAEKGWNIHRWRHFLYRSLTLHVPRTTSSYLNAAWTGKRNGGLNDRHKAWGTSHILAVSGFHVGIVMLGVALLFRRGKWRIPLLSLFLWLYIGLAGAPPSAVRAGLMLQIALLGELAGRPGSPLNSVSLAAVLLLLASPFWFWDIGWRLSVLAALVIAAVLERASSSDWRVWLFVSPLIWVATFPQVAWTFGAVPLVGVLVNLFAPAFFSFALTFASIAAVLRLIGVAGAGLLLTVAEEAFVMWGDIADTLAFWIPWQLSWNYFLAYCCTGIFLTLLCRALFVPWRSVALLAPLGSLAAFALFGG